MTIRRLGNKVESCGDDKVREAAAMARVTPRPSAERVKHVENVDNKVLNAVSSDCALGDLGGVVSNASNDYAAAAHVLAGEQKQEVAQVVLAKSQRQIMITILISVKTVDSFFFALFC